MMNQETSTLFWQQMDRYLAAHPITVSKSCSHSDLDSLDFDLWKCRQCGEIITFHLDSIGPHRAACQHLGGLVYLGPGRWRCTICGQEVTDLDLIEQKRERHNSGKAA